MFPFGVLLCLIWIYPIVKYKTSKDIYVFYLGLSICMETFIETGYFVKIGGYEFLYSDACILIVGIFSLILMPRIKISWKQLSLFFIFVLFILINNLFLSVWPYSQGIIDYTRSWDTDYFSGNLSYARFSMQTVMMDLRYILFFFIGIFCVNYLEEKDLKTIAARYLKFGIVILSYSLVEFLAESMTGTNAFHQMNNSFFGLASSTVSKVLLRGNTVALQGLTREPGHFAGSLFCMALILIMMRNKIKIPKLLLPVIFVFLLLSRSFAGLLYILILLLLYFCYVKNNKKVLIAVSLLCVLILFVQSQSFHYYIARINNLYQFFNQQAVNRVSSEQIRFLSIAENLKIFLQRPILGIGIGTTYSHSAVLSILSNMGLVGFTLWYYLSFHCIAKVKLFSHYFVSVISLLVAITFTQDFGFSYSMIFLLILLVYQFISEKEQATENITPLPSQYIKVQR